MEILHGFIYSLNSGQPDPPPGFFQRHKRKLGIILSLVTHFGILVFIFYQGVIAPFTDMAFVDEAYNEVKWIEITKLAKPLKYPAELLPQPGKVVSLDQMDAEREKQRELEKARAEARKKREKERKEREAAEKAEQERLEQERLAQEQADKLAENQQPEPPKPPTNQPKFGLINARPIKEIVGKVYAVYKTGGLDLTKAVFSLTLGYEVNEDGSLRDVHILKSSGSQQLDVSALNVANAISESHALMPLAALSANTATLELNDERATLKISGAAVTRATAEELSGIFSQQLAGLRLLMSFKNQDAATLLEHLEVSTEGNRLVANLTMTRAEASAMMFKNFGNLIPAQEKQPEAINKNHNDDFSQGSAF